MVSSDRSLSNPNTKIGPVTASAQVQVALRRAPAFPPPPSFASAIVIASCDIDKTALPASDHATFLRRDGALMLAGEHSRWRRAARVSRPSTYACAS